MNFAGPHLVFRTSGIWAENEQKEGHGEAVGRHTMIPQLLNEFL